MVFYVLLLLVVGFYSLVGYVKVILLWFDCFCGFVIGLVIVLGVGGGLVIML